MVARLRLNPSSARKYKPNYRKPPEDKQYKPGQSGNPTGRPKGEILKPTCSKNFGRSLRSEPTAEFAGLRPRRLFCERSLKRPGMGTCAPSNTSPH